MSASGKLRALQPFTISVEMTAYAGPKTAYELYDVPLPQLVALVEWVESYADATDWHAYVGTDGGRIDDKVDALLAALEEGLT
jgi:hypothetical protein